MSQNRGKQKQAAKKKKKREVAKARSRSAPLPDQSRALAREAAQFPPGPSFMSATWRSDDEAAPEAVAVIVTRAAPGNLFIPALALVDRTCLGVKDAFISSPATQAQVRAMVEALSEVQGEFEECDFLTAQSVVFHAIDYASTLGFEPHRDFPEPVFGPRPETLLDTPLAKPSRPHFVAGPDDDIERIVAQLQGAVGPGNFDVTINDGMGGALDVTGLGDLQGAVLDVEGSVVEES